MEKRLRDTKDYFYSETLELYVSKGPLKVDDRIVKSASECGFKLSWDDEGRINFISFSDAKKLLSSLGTSLLSPSEYWKFYFEMVQRNDEEGIYLLSSSDFTEWLDVTFEKDEQGKVYMIEHPQLSGKGRKKRFTGKLKEVSVPEGRPGWFNPRDGISVDYGLPERIHLKREKGTKEWSQTNWKYWSFFNCKKGLPVSPIRGYVTSSGTPSLDLDIPTDARQPVLMIRECRKELLDPSLDPQILKKAESLVEEYLSTTVDYPATQNPTEHEKFYSKKEEVFKFLEDFGKKFALTKESSVSRFREKFIDILGIIKVIARAKREEKVLERVNKLTKDLFGLNRQINYTHFLSFAKKSKIELKKALFEKRRIVFVMGHKNPDTDTVVSSLFEAFRNTFSDKEAFIPVVQASRIPDEIRRLLGEGVSKSIVLSEGTLYKKALTSGLARWILVDQNVSEVQRFAISIIDHHILSDKAKRFDIPKTWEMAGSTASLVTQKFLGMGLSLDKDLTRILYGATLMDTENRSRRKMTYKDGLIMDGLKNDSGIENDSYFYQDLMGYLLNTDDAEILFYRDYKQDWGTFGFAVVKVKGAFSVNGEKVIKEDLLKRLVLLAEKNNKDKNFPLTIIKVADYLGDNETVNKERVYLIFNQFASHKLRETMFIFITKIIEHEYKGMAKIKKGENFVEFWGVGDQLSRKVTAPFLEPIVNAFNEYYFSPDARKDLLSRKAIAPWFDFLIQRFKEYYFSPSTGLYIKREFLKVDNKIKNTAKKLAINLSFDKEGRINNITYHEAKRLLSLLRLRMMSLPEYWRVLKEVEEVHDEQMKMHLRSPGFVELLDTVILEKNYLVNHPQVVLKDGVPLYKGEKREVDIIDGLPGLIYPSDINEETGFPKKVYDPKFLGNPGIWRYWSPDGPVCIATRGHIFLLNQPAFDTKIHPDDALPNLGIRPCALSIKEPDIEFSENEKGVFARVIK